MDNENTLTRQELLSCLELGKALTSELDAAKLYGRILQKVSDLLPAENWSLFLIDAKSGERDLLMFLKGEHTIVRRSHTIPIQSYPRG